MKKSFLLILCLLSGCTTLLPHDPALNRAPIPLTEELVRRSQPPQDSVEFSMLEKAEWKLYKEYECSVITSSGISLRYNYIQTKTPGKKPLIVIFNILKDPTMIVSHLLSNYLVTHNYDCVIIRQDFFMDKSFVRPVVTSRGNLLAYDDYNTHLSQNVLRILRQWMPKQPNLSGEVGFVGVSMGGFHAIGAAALYPEAKITVAMMSGASNVDVFKTSEESIVIHNRTNLLAEYIKNYGPSGEDRLYREIDTVVYNIENLARAIETSRVRLVITTEDTSVPTFTQWRLYRLLGGPESLIVPSGHYTLALYYFSVRSQLVDWLNEAFGRNSED